MVNSGTPAEVEIDESLVRALLGEQLPMFAGLPLAPLSNGWDNDIWSLGDDLLVRLPRREVAAQLVVNEQVWLPHIASLVTIDIPVPVHAGVPQDGYPWCWSVVPRFRGDIAARAPFADDETEARRLARFLRQLHVPAPAGAPHNPYRGIPLMDVSGSFEKRRMQLMFDLIDHGFVPDEVSTRFYSAMDGLGFQGPAVWVHGDLHAANILVDNGEISAVIDWGDICGGDPACDVSVAYSLFTGGARRAFMDEYGVETSGPFGAARGWALHFALAYLASGDGDPLITQMGWRTLANALSD